MATVVALVFVTNSRPEVGEGDGAASVRTGPRWPRSRPHTGAYRRAGSEARRCSADRWRRMVTSSSCALGQPTDPARGMTAPRTR